MTRLKLTDEITEAICKDIEAGAPQQYAAISNGISESTYYNWLSKGRKAKSGKYRRFADKIDKAIANAIIFRVKRMKRAGETTWQADAWWLERMAPKSFAKVDKHEVDMKADVKSEVTVNLLEQIKAKRKELNDIE